MSKDLKGKILAGRILIKPQEAESKTSGGLYIPETAKKKPNMGIVILTGAAKTDELMELSVGDNVFYAKRSGTELNIDGEGYLLMSQTDILYIL